MASGADDYIQNLRNEIEEIAAKAETLENQVRELRKARLAQPTILHPRKTIGFDAERR